MRSIPKLLNGGQLRAARDRGGSLRPGRPLLLGWTVLLVGCVGAPPPPSVPQLTPDDARAWIDRSLPATVADRAGWVTDIYAGFGSQSIPATRENLCAAIAVLEQESGVRVDPQVAGLPAIAWREIDERAAHVGLPRLVVHGVLQLKSSTGRSYSDRIDTAKTEKDLSDVYEDFIGAVPLGRTLFENSNPIRTRGPMQVHVAFANQYAASKPYPYPVRASISDELFTRRGGVYFGIAHLLAYQAPYDDILFRFADFNAGQYASRNAAFQRAVSAATGVPLEADGALLPPAADPAEPGSTELALQTLATRLHLSDSDIHSDLEKGKTRAFEQTQVYQRIFAIADRLARHALPRAVVPVIVLKGPKISRPLTTDWYAHRVDDRYRTCLRRHTP